MQIFLIQSKKRIVISSEPYYKADGYWNGAIWHQFSGLSTPVLLWHQSYYKVGTITCGYNGLILEQDYDDKLCKLSCRIKFLETSDKASIILVMPSSSSYCVRINGRDMDFYESISGVIEISMVVDKNREWNIECI